MSQTPEHFFKGFTGNTPLSIIEHFILLSSATVPSTDWLALGKQLETSLEHTTTCNTEGLQIALMGAA